MAFTPIKLMQNRRFWLVAGVAGAVVAVFPPLMGVLLLVLLFLLWRNDWNPTRVSSKIKGWLKSDAAVTDTARAEQASAETAEASLRQAVRTEEDNATEVNNLIQTGCSPNTMYKQQWSILHEAVQRGHIETVKVLLDAGADKDCKGGLLGGQYPLTVAVKTGRLDMVRLLIESGANVDLVNKKLIEVAYVHRNLNNQGREIMRLILDSATKDSGRRKSWRTIDIINERKDVCALGAISSTVGPSSRLEFPYSGLEATLMFQQENALIRFNMEPNVADSSLSGDLTLKVRVDGLDDSWIASITPGSNDLVISSSSVVKAITAWVTAEKFCITVPFYASGDAIFCWKLNGAAAAIGKTFAN